MLFSFCMIMQTQLAHQQYMYVICTINEIIELYFTNVIHSVIKNKDTGNVMKYSRITSNTLW